MVNAARARPSADDRVWHVAHWRRELMSIFIVQLGTPRKAHAGLRIGTVRRPPRGVRKSDFARLDYYDVWFPNLSPSAEPMKEALGADQQAWVAFNRKFRREMSEPDRSRELDMLARCRVRRICRWADTARTRAAATGPYYGNFWRREARTWLRRVPRAL
jgi:uncharacterized protein YeaO (DUF488 family)